jgi:transcriptional regulator
VVLQLLKAEPTNGYDLSLRIQAVTRDVLSVKAGSLYPALYRLEKRGLVKAKWAETESGRRAKVYSVTKAGQKHLVGERESWERFAGALGAILNVRGAGEPAPDVGDRAVARASEMRGSPYTIASA